MISFRRWTSQKKAASMLHNALDAQTHTASGHVNVLGEVIVPTERGAVRHAGLAAGIRHRRGLARAARRRVTVAQLSSVGGPAHHENEGSEDEGHGPEEGGELGHCCLAWSVRGLVVVLRGGKGCRCGSREVVVVWWWCGSGVVVVVMRRREERKRERGRGGALM